MRGGAKRRNPLSFEPRKTGRKMSTTEFRHDRVMHTSIGGNIQVFKIVC